MFNNNRSNPSAVQHMRSSSGAIDSAQVDAGLRRYMLGIYNYMALGLLVTAIIAWYMSTQFSFNADGTLALTPLAQTLYGTPLRWVVLFAPLGMIFLMGPMANRSESVGPLRAMYFLFTALMGLSLYYVFLAYSSADVTRAFLVTVIMFGSLSLYGYTTKRNLAPMGTFLFMALIGLIVASLIGLFFSSPIMEMVIMYGGVLIFAGLTAYDTWRIKREYYAYADQGVLLQKAGVMGAVSLYLDFINLFLFILRILGGRGE